MSVYIVTRGDALNVLVSDADDIRDELRRLHSAAAIDSGEVVTWRWTADGYARATWGRGGGEGIVSGADVPADVIYALDEVGEAERLGRAAGRLFFNEYGAIFAADVSDWDATAWEIDRATLDPPLAAALFPAYQAALVAATRRLAGAA